MTDYIQILISYIPVLVMTAGLVLGAKFISSVLLLRQKQNRKQENNAFRRKSLLESAEEFFENAPQLYVMVSNQIEELKKKGATEEQLKSLQEKQKWIGYAADPMIGPFIQPLVLGGIRMAKGWGIKF